MGEQKLQSGAFPTDGEFLRKVSKASVSGAKETPCLPFGFSAGRIQEPPTTTLYGTKSQDILLHRRECAFDVILRCLSYLIVLLQ